MKKKNIRSLYSIEAEKSVLGCLMLDNSRWDEIISCISSKDFFFKTNGLIFIEMEKLIHLKLPIDIITLSDSFKKKKILDSVCIFSYLSEILKINISLSNILVYVNLIKEYSINRQLVLTSNEIVDYVYNNDNLSSNELLDFAESKIFNINNTLTNQNYNIKSIDTILDKTIETLIELKKKPNQFLTGLDTGFIKLNEMTLGFQNSELIIIAARPSLGKTTLALNICENIAFLQNKPILIFSLEMSSNQIIIKMISSLSKVELTKIRTGNLNGAEFSKVMFIKDKLKQNKKIYIDDSSRLTPTELRIKSRRLFKEHGGLSLIMIDYLQLMHVPNFKESRTLEISEISRSLKSLAKELNIPIIALSQLNRSLEQRINKRPVNSDLRDSGAIEQDADLIIFIHKEENIKNKISEFLYELIISKQRNGPVGVLKLLFNNKCSKFYDFKK